LEEGDLEEAAGGQPSLATLLNAGKDLNALLGLLSFPV